MNNKATKSTILNIIYRLKNTPPAFHIDIDIDIESLTLTLNRFFAGIKFFLLMFGFMELYVHFTTSYTEIDCHPTLTTFYRNMVITLTTCIVT